MYLFGFTDAFCCLCRVKAGGHWQCRTQGVLGSTTAWRPVWTQTELALPHIFINIPGSLLLHRITPILSEYYSSTCLLKEVLIFVASKWPIASESFYSETCLCSMTVYWQNPIMWNTIKLKSLFQMQRHNRFHLTLLVLFCPRALVNVLKESAQIIPNGALTICNKLSHQPHDCLWMSFRGRQLMQQCLNQSNYLLGRLYPVFSSSIQCGDLHWSAI